METVAAGLLSQPAAKAAAAMPGASQEKEQENGHLLGRSFELVYFTPDNRFRHRSSFREPKGKPEISTELRIEYLKRLAKRLENSEGIQAGELMATEQAVKEALAKLKPPPFPKTRRVQTLTDWKWQMDADGKADNLWPGRDFDDEYWNEGRVPFVRETAADLWFRRRVALDSPLRAFLEVAAAIDECWIWVNGKELVHHVGYGPFRIEIPKELRQGDQSVLAVRIPAKLGDQIGLGDRVQLIYTGDQQIEDIFAFTQEITLNGPGDAGADETVRCTVANLGGSAFQGSLQVTVSPWKVERAAVAAAGKGTQPISLGPGERKTVNVTVPLKRVALWEPGTPNLYAVHVRLVRSGRSIDDDVVTTGIRKIEQREGRLFLNNRPFFMKGFLDMLTYPPQPLINPHSLIAAPDDGIARTILTARAIGANTIRIHPDGMRDTGKPTASGFPPITSMTDGTNYSRYAEIADQLGICLTWPTRFWGWQASFFEGDKERQLADDLPPSIRFVRNHPSIIVYEGMNEVGSTMGPRHHERETAAEQARVALYRKITSGYVQTVSKLDPTRLITPDSGWVHPSKGPVALEPYHAEQSTFYAPQVYWDMHAYFGWYDPIWKLWPVISRVANPQTRKRAFIMSELGSEAMPDWSRYEDQPWYGVWVNNAWSPDGKIEKRVIGRAFRVLTNSEYKLSEAYQALIYQLNASALRDHGADGMLICTLADGFAMGFYHKGAVDIESRAKLGAIMAHMVMQKYYPNGMDGDLVFAPGDKLKIRVSSISPVETRKGATLSVSVQNEDHEEVAHREFNLSSLGFGVTEPMEWQPRFPKQGFYFIEYALRSRK